METTFGLALDAFVRSLKGENLSYPTLADGLRAQLVAEAAVQSLKTGVPVKVENWQPEQFVSL
jgi:myo-inositol 2-dehydrogenase/D-chiro-inositol 1-dehydrogenase